MTHYEYKVVPAPRRAKKVRGVKATEDLFAMTLTDAINEVARQGWEYVRVEHLAAEAPGGWFRGGASGEQTVLVFRRDREALGPRLAAVRTDPDAGAPAMSETAAGHIAAERASAERAAVERVQAHLRHREFRVEPRLGDTSGEPPTPLRPAPRIGPAES